MLLRKQEHDERRLCTIHNKINSRGVRHNFPDICQENVGVTSGDIHPILNPCLCLKSRNEYCVLNCCTGKNIFP